MKIFIFLLSTILINNNEMNIQTATFGSGCFWCSEAIYQEVNGIISATSGYMGGEIKNPTYKQVCSGTTGFAEVVQIKFDKNIISYSEILEIFWKTHNPTTLNQQGADKGTQYRSAIFYHTEEQKQIAEKYKIVLEKEKIWKDPIVTEITKNSTFYKAEANHQDYYSLNKNGNQYCTFVITPKVEKFKKIFKDKIKK